MEQPRTIHHEDGDFKVEGELSKEGYYFLHINVENYSHTVQKKIDLLFEEMKRAALEVGFPQRFYTATPNKKYATYLGGELMGELTTECGEEIGVFKWELEQS